MTSPSLDDLAAFAAVARRRSFRAAAAERGVSPSALSQAVRDLEERLGTRLLHRTTRSVAPTEAGERLLARLGPALADLAAAVDAVHATDGVVAGVLRINAPAPAIDLVLAPLVAPFLARHPQVRVEIVAETALVDIVAEGFDAGVRWDESLPRDMVALPLCGEQRYVVVGAPALVERYGLPTHPRDLEGLPCLRLRFPSGRVLPWEFERSRAREGSGGGLGEGGRGAIRGEGPPSPREFEGGAERVVIRPDGPLVASHGPMLLRAAVDGLGFASTFEGYAADDVAAGRLVRVLDDWLPPFPGPRLYWPSRRQVPPPLQAFAAFVRERRNVGSTDPTDRSNMI